MKILKIMGIWAAVIVAEILIALTLPVHQEIATKVSAELAASANMSTMPGTKQVIDGWPVLIWFIAPVIGGGLTVYTLMKNEQPSY